MDLKQLEYIVSIERYGTIKDAAEHLYVTPSALNQQLLKLEKELDVSLFERRNRQMIPTRAGQLYINSARQMLALKQMTYSKLRDLSGQMTGSFRIGLTFEHGSTVFSQVYPDFHKLYPGIQIQCLQLMVPTMLEMVANHTLDLAFVLLGAQNIPTDLHYLPFSEENLVLGVPASHPAAEGLDPENSPSSTINLSFVRDDEFALARSTSTMRQQLIDPIFRGNDILPSIIVESSFNHFLQQLTAQGICSTIIPESTMEKHRDICWFYLPGMPRFQFGCVYATDYRISKPLQDFIGMAKAYAQKHLDFPKPDSIAQRLYPL